MAIAWASVGGWWICRGVSILPDGPIASAVICIAFGVACLWGASVQYKRVCHEREDAFENGRVCGYYLGHDAGYRKGTEDGEAEGYARGWVAGLRQFQEQARAASDHQSGQPDSPG